MTKTKLEIIGPYTPAHEGPFCTRDGRLVRIVTRIKGSKEYPIIGIRFGDSTPVCFSHEGSYQYTDADSPHDLMNAREVPVAREFWINEYNTGYAHRAWESSAGAAQWTGDPSYVRTIHVREVLPGDGE